MDATLSRLRAWPLWQKAKRFAVSAVHEDSVTGARAEEFCQTLAKCLGRTPEISKEMWLLTELRTPQLRAIAAREAATADLVIVSVHHAETLPKEVTGWIDLWLKQKRSRPAVLLARLSLLEGGFDFFRGHWQRVSSGFEGLLGETRFGADPPSSRGIGGRDRV